MANVHQAWTKFVITFLRLYHVCREVSQMKEYGHNGAAGMNVNQYAENLLLRGVDLV